jgi:hypothetical protein
LVGLGAANAASIIYTDTATASGTIGAAVFTDQTVSVSFYGDTANVTEPNPSFYANSVGNAFITIGTGGAIAFTDSMQFFDNQTVGAAGIGDLAVGSVLDTYSTYFGMYTGSTAIGPLGGASFAETSYDFGTVDGTLNFTSFSSTSTFTATTASVTPEPSSLVLLATGIACAAGWQRRRLFTV